MGTQKPSKSLIWVEVDFDAFVEVAVALRTLCFTFGYGWADVIPVETDPPDVLEGQLDDFLDGLRKHVRKNEPVIIETIGHEKCQYVAASRIVVTPEDVSYRNLDGPGE